MIIRLDRTWVREGEMQSQCRPCTAAVPAYSERHHRMEDYSQGREESPQNVKESKKETKTGNPR